MSYNNRGMAYINKGEHDKAIADFNKAIRLDADLAMPHCNRGLAFLRKGDANTAIADCTDAIRLDPNFALAYVVRAAAYEKMAKQPTLKETWPKPRSSATRRSDSSAGTR